MLKFSPFGLFNSCEIFDKEKVQNRARKFL